MLYKLKYSTLLLVLLLAVLASSKKEVLYDDNSEANIRYALEQHIELDWTVNITAETVIASSKITFLALREVCSVSLDVWDLEIDTSNCLLEDSRTSSRVEGCEVKTGAPNQGDVLIVELILIGGSCPKKNSEFNVTVEYVVKRNARAFKWFTPEETALKKYPMFYTVAEPIYARTFLPCQDTPAAKFTWKATLKVTPEVPDIETTAELKEISSFDDYIIGKFESKTSIPSYQLSFAAGEWFEDTIEGGTGLVKIIGEKPDLDIARVYFKDAEKYIEYVENYLDRVRDFETFRIFMPHASVPTGAIENNRFLYFSPTLLPKNLDSLDDTLGKSVLIHSIINIWIGGFVTHENWTCLWLTHGMATYIEREMISAFLNVEDFRHLSQLGSDELTLAVQQYGATDSYSSLSPTTTNENPSHAINPVVYNKGSEFFEYLNYFVLGNLTTLDLIRMWLNKDGDRSECTIDFEDFFKDYIKKNIGLPEEILEETDFPGWIYQPGMPNADKQEVLDYIWYTQDSLKAVSLAQEFIELGGSGMPKDYTILLTWDSNLKLIFLNYFAINRVALYRNPRQVRIFKLLDQTYHFTNDPSLKVQAVWTALALESQYFGEVIEHAKTILSSTGNLAIILPIFEALMNSGREDLANNLFEANIYFYHPVAADEILRVVEPPNLIKKPLLTEKN